MKKRFKSIGLYTTSDNSRVLQITKQVLEILASVDKRVSLSKSSSISKKIKIKQYSDNYLKENCDLIIVIGGDGSLISAARKFGYYGIPVLGINLGKLGFLTDIPPEDLTFTLNDVLSGNYFVDDRFFLEAKTLTSDGIALNEVVVHSKKIAQLIEYELFLNQKFVYRQRSDGILLSTPTGSTAYSLSGNGPIIHPEVKAISLLPMFPHSLNTRPLIIDEKTSISIKVLSKNGAIISLDSHKYLNLKKNEEVEIIKSKPKLKLIHPANHDFYSACRMKLGWSLNISDKDL